VFFVVLSFLDALQKQLKLKKKRVCTTDYEPVCAKDAKTYMNKCIAGSIEILHEGECENDKIIINSFIECEKKGFPIMESYPRQCKGSNGTIFVETIS
jgi:Kazal-type serine protease inhibitor-like protein